MTTTNTNAAKLTPAEVQQVRDLHRFGFSFKSLASAFGVCHRSIRDIIRGRSWFHLPDVPGPLPILHEGTALHLRLRRGQRLSPEQQQAIDDYRNQLSTTIESEPEREAYALQLLETWTPRRPRRQQEVIAL